MSRRLFLTLLLALLAARIVLMATAPVFEPSEARYAAMCANMARDGDYAVPHFTYELRYQAYVGKPPLFFQVGGLLCRAFGLGCPVAQRLAVRLFPLLSSLLLLAILHWAVRRRAGPEEARLAVLVCATTTAFFADAGIAMLDMPLTLAVAGALLVYGAGGPFALVGLLLGFGFLVKGPVALVLFALPVAVDAAVNRRWRTFVDLRWLLTLAVAAAVSVPLFAFLEVRQPGSVRYILWNESVLRFVTSDYGDRYGGGREAFYGVAALWALVATLPWSLGIVRKLRAFRKFGRSCGADFWLLSVLTITGFWCLSTRVLLYYLFPVVPLFAAHLALCGDVRRCARFVVPAAILSVGVVAGVSAFGAFLSDSLPGPQTPFVLGHDNYAYEFYHGPKSESELSDYREEARRFAELERRQKEKARP